MPVNTLFRWTAVAAVVTGLCIILGSVLSHLFDSNLGPVFNFLALLIGLFAFTGWYLWQREQSGTLGAVAFVVLFVGLALFMAQDFFGAFVMPSLPEEEVMKLADTPAMLTFAVSGLFFFTGAILFGIASLRAGVFPKFPTVLFMIGFLPTPLGNTFPALVVIGAILAGGGIAWIGLSLWTFAGEGDRLSA